MKRQPTQIAAALLLAWAAVAHAQSGGAAPAPADGTAGAPMERKALDALDRMGHYLRSLTQFEVRASSMTQGVLDNGQNASFVHDSTLKVRRPDRLRAEVSGPGGERNVKGIVYDGKHFTVYDSRNHYFSTQPAPPTIDALVHVLADKYGIELPLADLFYWGLGKNDALALTSAQLVGLERIDSRWCYHYAYQQQGADWELWLDSGKQPLPCRMAIVDTTQASRPLHEVTYHWNLSPRFDAGTFTYRPPTGAHAIEMRPAAAGQEGQ